MDPVPHNVGGGVRGHPGVTGVGHMSGRYREQDLPAGAREWVLEGVQGVVVSFKPLRLILKARLLGLLGVQ